MADSIDRLLIKIEADSSIFQYAIGKAQSALDSFDNKVTTVSEAVHKSMTGGKGWSSAFDLINRNTKTMTTNFDKLVADAPAKMEKMANAAAKLALLNFNKPIKDATELTSRIQKLGQMTETGFISKGVALEQVNALKEKFPELSRQINKTFKEGEKSAGRFDMRLLSILFGFMALQRATGNMLRAIANTYLTAEDNTSELAMATTRLHAAWEFLKFSIFDALDNELFVGFLDWLVNVIDWFSQLGSGSKIALLIIVGGLYVISGLLVGISQFALGWAAIFGTGGFLTASGGILGTAGAVGGAGGKGLIGISGLLTSIAGMTFGALIGGLIAIGIELAVLYAGFKLLQWGLNKLADLIPPPTEEEQKKFQHIRDVQETKTISGQLPGMPEINTPYALDTSDFVEQGYKINTNWEQITAKINLLTDSMIQKIASPKNSLVQSLDSTKMSMDNISNVAIPTLSTNSTQFNDTVSGMTSGVKELTAASKDAVFWMSKLGTGSVPSAEDIDTSATTTPV